MSDSTEREPLDFEIGFEQEAGEQLVNAIDSLTGLVCLVTPKEENEPFYAVVYGHDRHADDYRTVRVRVQGKDGEEIGPFFSVIALRLDVA